MSHILSFEIHDLAGRPGPCAFELNRDVNVFFGLNGSGKTSLLKILHSAMRNDASFLTNVPFTSASVQMYSEAYKVTVKRTLLKTASRQVQVARAPEEQGPPTFVEEPTLSWQSTPPSPFKTLAHAYLPTSRLYSQRVTWQRPLAEGPLEQALDAEFGTILDHLWTRYVAGVSVRVQNAQESGLVSVLTKILDDAPIEKPREIQEFGVVYRRVQSFLARAKAPSRGAASAEFIRRYESSELLRSVVDSLSRVEEQIEQAQRPRNNLESMLNKLFNNKTVSLKDQKLEIKTSGDVPVPLAGLSSGEKQMLKLLLEVLAAGELNTIIIDEPELSLHVDWQQELIDDMRTLSPSSQLILATHSPEIMANLTDDQVFKL